MPLKAFNSSPKKPSSSQGGVLFDPRCVAQVLHAAKPPKAALPPEESRITVHAAVSRISVLYEKLRNAVDYKDEHLIRKGAIVRILRRQLVLESDPVIIAHNLVYELIAARYLPNEVLPESLIEDAATVVRKLQAVSSVRMGGDRYSTWLIGIASAELEETLADPHSDKAYVTFLYQRLSESLKVKNVPIEETERHLEIFIACYRTFVKADEEQIAYKYVRAFLPQWMRPNEWVDRPIDVAEELYGVHERIRQRLVSPLAQRFVRAVRPWAVTMWMLRDALSKDADPAVLLSSREDTQRAVASITSRREEQARGKIWRGTLRAIIYLLITKIIFALALEVPIEKWLYHELDMKALMINISLPPAIMLLVGIFIRRPTSENSKRILEHLDMLMTASGIPVQEIRVPRPRVGGTAFVFGLVYLFMYALSFGLIGWGLMKLHFTPVAIAVFYFFLCVVSFFGYRLGSVVRETIVVKQRERLTTAIWDFFLLPILRAGRWLSSSVSRINVFAFILDVIFEAPLKLFLGALEETLKFIREKKDELSE